MTNPVIYLTGNLLAVTPREPTNYHNSSDPDFGMVIHGANAAGAKADIFKLDGRQINSGQTTFANGQWWTLSKFNGPTNPTEQQLADESNWTVLTTNLAPKPDLIQNHGITANWVVFENQGTKLGTTSGGAEHMILHINTSFPFHDGVGGTRDDIIVSAPRDEEGNVDRNHFNFQDVKDLFCFVEGTLIEADRGQIPVEELSVGDLVLTRDNGYQPVRWIGSTQLSAIQLLNAAKFYPIRIEAGALAPNQPSADLLVSPQHRVLVRSQVVERMFGQAEVLVPAKQLLQLEGVSVATELTSVKYFHIMFEQHQIVSSNGADTESFYPGPQVLKSIDAPALEELYELFPELRALTYVPEGARMMLSGRQARKLVVRHIEKNRDLVLTAA